MNIFDFVSKNKGDRKFQIPITTACALRCTFCENSDSFQANQKTIDIDKIIEYINFAVKFGADNIELGQYIGDAMLTNTLDLKAVLDYCESVNEIKYVTIFTSLTFINEKNIDILTPKIFLNISIYGDSKELFETRTKKKGSYDSFIKNMAHLNRVDRAFEIEPLNRTGKEMDKDFIDLCGISDWQYILDDVAEDWPPFTTEKIKGKYALKPYRKGICEAAVGDVTINYDDKLTLCSWFHHPDLIIGDMDEGFDILYDRYSDIIKKQKFNLFNEFCYNCSAYEPVSPEDS